MYFDSPTPDKEIKLGRKKKEEDKEAKKDAKFRLLMEYSIIM